MAKKTITEYEQAEETVTKIKCGSCDEEWDHRGIRGKQGMKTVVLDLRDERSSGYGRTRWRSQSVGSSMFGDDTHRMNGEAINDFCNDCWQQFLPDTSFVEVEEPEYYVEEKQREEYYCDFCEAGMGDDVDHEVSVNPRAVKEKKHMFGESVEKDVLTRSLEETFRTSHRRKWSLSIERDECYDCCEECAAEMFDLGSNSPNSTSSGIMAAVASGIKNMLLGV